MSTIENVDYLAYTAAFLGWLFNLVFLILCWRCWGISRYKGWLLLAIASTVGLVLGLGTAFATPLLTARYAMSEYVYYHHIITIVSTLLRNIPYLLGLIFLLQREKSLQELREVSLFR